MQHPGRRDPIRDGTTAQPRSKQGFTDRFAVIHEMHTPSAVPTFLWQICSFSQTVLGPSIPTHLSNTSGPCTTSKSTTHAAGYTLISSPKYHFHLITRQKFSPLTHPVYASYYFEAENPATHPNQYATEFILPDAAALGSHPAQKSRQPLARL